MSNEEEKTGILGPYKLRNVIKSWGEVFGPDALIKSYYTDKIDESSIAFFDLNPQKSEKFVYPIPDDKPIQIGRIKQKNTEITPFIPSMVEIDPGMRMGNAGIIVWRVDNFGKLHWFGTGILYLLKKKWVEFPHNQDYLVIHGGDYIRGLIGPWWGFLIKGINPNVTLKF